MRDELVSVRNIVTALGRVAMVGKKARGRLQFAALV